MKLRSKNKSKVIYSETVDIPAAHEALLCLQDRIIMLYEAEGISSEMAHEETTKLLFSKILPSLNMRTVAQWIALGGDERKAYEVVKDFLVEKVKESQKAEVQKTVIAKVFGGGR